MHRDAGLRLDFTRYPEDCPPSLLRLQVQRHRSSDYIAGSANSDKYGPTEDTATLVHLLDVRIVCLRVVQKSSSDTQNPRRKRELVGKVHATFIDWKTLHESTLSTW